jgi:hypothetical protein
MDHQPGADREQGGLQHHAQNLRHRTKAAGDVARARGARDVAAVEVAPVLGDAGGHAHGRDRLGVAPARLHQRAARCRELRGAARRAPRQHFGQQGQGDEDDRAAERGKPDIGMEQKAHAEVDRQPRQVEQSDRAGAGEEAAYGVEVADRLRAFAPDAERERQADNGVIDAQAQRFVEAVADADQDPAADCVDDALRGVESTGQDQERDEGWNAAARYHPIVDFEHEQRAGEHQNVAHPAEQGDGHEGPPAGTECSRKLCTCGRLSQRAGEVGSCRRCLPPWRAESHDRAY